MDRGKQYRLDSTASVTPALRDNYLLYYRERENSVADLTGRNWSTWILHEEKEEEEEQTYSKQIYK